MDMKKSLFSLLIIALLIFSVTTLGCTDNVPSENDVQKEKETYAVLAGDGVSIHEFEESSKRTVFFYDEGKYLDGPFEYKYEDGKYIFDKSTGLAEGYEFTFNLNEMKFSRKMPDVKNIVRDIFNITDSDIAVFIDVWGLKNKEFSGSIETDTQEFSVESVTPEVYTLDDTNDVVINIDSTSADRMVIMLYDVKSNVVTGRYPVRGPHSISRSLHLSRGGDEEFRNWIEDTTKELEETLKTLTINAENNNYEGLKSNAPVLLEQCDKALYEIDDFNLSELDNVREEYKKALIADREAADKLYEAGGSKDPDTLDEAVNKLEEGIEHFEKAWEYLN